MNFGMASFAVVAGPVANTFNVVDVPLWGIPVGICIGAVSGLLPDIDEPNAMLGRGSWVPRSLGPAARMLGTVVSLPFRLLGYVLKGVLGHRGGTHSFAMSIVFTLAFAIPLTMLLGSGADWILLTIWAGFMSHLFADALNPSGVPFFWPLRSKHKTVHVIPKALRIPTRTPPDPREMLIRMSMIGITIVILGYYYGVDPVAKHVTGLF